MKHSSRTGKVLGIALATVVAGSVLPAFAGLGGDAASVDADIAKMKGQARATPVAGYTMSEITLPSGTVVHEFVSAEGKVFAVSWKGMAVPDLSQTLGTYFAEYKAAATATPHASHHNLTVQQPDLVVRTGGHMRNWYGQAYVLSLLPPNFSLDDIK
ncbi:MAG TPA: DUF2844 domain-containing protein [Steroidobacteraceae bacterium]|jgi:hypothetical protein|nr:DUF2844 domain-containing protein [Steroidobacteraceae bacterium]